MEEISESALDRLKPRAVSTITSNQYMQLLGLKTAADQQNAILSKLFDAALAITQETGLSGHTLDFIYNDNIPLEECLRRLEIKIVEDTLPELPHASEQALAVALAEVADNPEIPPPQKLATMRTLASSSYRRITGRDL